MEPISTLQIVGNARFGGATVLMLRWSAHLAARGHHVEVQCTDSRMQAEVNALDGVALVDDIWIPKEIDPRADARALAQLYRRCRDRRYDVVHTYTATPSLLGRAAATAARVPVVVNHQGGWAVNPTSSFAERIFYTPLEYLGNVLCTRNICASETERRLGIDGHLAPPSRLVAINNGIDASPFIAATEPELRDPHRASLRRAADWPEDAIVVGSTGRLVPGKDHATEIDAVAALRTRRDDIDVRLALAGDGEERDALEARCRSLGLGEQVHFFDFVDDIPAFLAALDVWVSATLTEGLSVALLEALASALPVVTTSIPANTEVVRHDVNGLTFESGHAEGLADALERLIDRPDLAEQLGRSGRRTVLDEYSMEQMFRDTELLYEQLLAEARPGRARPEERAAA